MPEPLPPAPPAAPGIAIRPASPDDERPVARLLYETATGMYDIYAGGRPRALRILSAAFRRPGNNASLEIVTVAEIDGEVAGALATFPAEEGDRRARRFLRIALARTPPWTWPRTIRIFYVGADASPPPPERSLYVDALATDGRFRRRGVARALIEEAARQAAAGGLEWLALDTAATNAGAQALYEGAGFEVTERRPPSGPIPGVIGYARPVTSPCRTPAATPDGDPSR